MEILRSKMLAMVVVASTLLGVAATPVSAENYTHRQYYGDWHRHATKNYHYRSYYYKPTATYSGYKHHYVVYFPARPTHYYYYNPYTKVYWGRCPVKTEGQGEYSLLAEADRKGNIDDIAEKAFPAPGKLPAIPESKDSVALDLPPDDLPNVDKTP